MGSKKDEKFHPSLRRWKAVEMGVLWRMAKTKKGLKPWGMGVDSGSIARSSRGDFDLIAIGGPRLGAACWKGLDASVARQRAKISVRVAIGPVLVESQINGNQIEGQTLGPEALKILVAHLNVAEHVVHLGAFHEDAPEAKAQKVHAVGKAGEGRSCASMASKALKSSPWWAWSVFFAQANALGKPVKGLKIS